jgi:hypothetical protein
MNPVRTNGGYAFIEHRDEAGMATERNHAGKRGTQTTASQILLHGGQRRDTASGRHTRVGECTIKQYALLAIRIANRFISSALTHALYSVLQSSSCFRKYSQYCFTSHSYFGNGQVRGTDLENAKMLHILTIIKHEF